MYSENGTLVITIVQWTWGATIAVFLLALFRQGLSAWERLFLARSVWEKWILYAVVVTAAISSLLTIAQLLDFLVHAVCSLGIALYAIYRSMLMVASETSENAKRLS